MQKSHSLLSTVNPVVTAHCVLERFNMFTKPRTILGALSLLVLLLTISTVVLAYFTVKFHHEKESPTVLETTDSQAVSVTSTASRLTTIVTTPSIESSTSETTTIYKFSYAPSNRTIVIDDSPGALQAVQIIKKSMNATADPCLNFYNFACGSFVERYKHEEILDKNPEVSQLMLRGIETMKSLIVNLNNTNTTEITDYKAKLAHTWKMCLKEAAKPHNESAAEVRQMVDDLGGWPLAYDQADNSSWVQVAAQVKRLMALPTLVEVQVYDINQLQFHLADVPELPDRESEAYQLFIHESVKLVTSIYNETQLDLLEVQDKVEEMLEFARRLSAVAEEAIMWPFDSFRVDQVEQDYQGLCVKEYITDIYSLSAYYAIEFSQIQTDFNHSGLMVLSEFLANSDVSTVKNYIIWQFVMSQRIFMMNFHPRLRTLVLGPNKYRDAMMNELEYECIEWICGALGQACSAAYFLGNADTAIPDQTAVNKVNGEFNTLAGYVRSAYMDMFLSTTWMANELRHKVVSLFDQMKYWISGMASSDRSANRYFRKDSMVNIMNKVAAFLAWKGAETVMSGVTTDPGQTIPMNLNPLIVNAFYNPSENAYRMLPGILQEPFYADFDHPISEKFGTYVTIMGHEVGHAIDMQNILKLGIPDVTKQRVLNMTKCLADYYSKFRDDTGKRIDGYKTIGETSADLIGFRAAFLAFKTWQRLEGDTGVDQRLKGLQEYSMEQIMYIKYGQTFCSNINIYQGDPHPPGKYRLEGTLHHDPEFHKLFKCPAEVDRCTYIGE